MHKTKLFFFSRTPPPPKVDSVGWHWTSQCCVHNIDGYVYVYVYVVYFVYLYVVFVGYVVMQCVLYVSVVLCYVVCYVILCYVSLFHKCQEIDAVTRCPVGLAFFSVLVGHYLFVSI